MAEDKRKRGEQTPGSEKGQDGQRGREGKPGGSMESPGSGRTRRVDEDESQE